MIGLIAILFIVGWGIISFGIANALAKRKWKKYQVFFLATGIFCLPFAEEIYIAVSFRAHCAVYGGITQLEPIETDSVIMDGGGYGVPRLLAHPAIQSVLILRDADDELGGKELWVSVSKDQTFCQEPINNLLLTSSFGTGRVAAQQLTNDGWCFTTTVHPNKRPTIAIKKSYEVRHELFTILLPYEVVEWRKEIWDTSTSTPKVASSFSTLKVQPGMLRRAIWPHVHPYVCALGQDGGIFSKPDFPYGNPVFQFYEKAILPASK
ncbi:hypothetical protein [Kordiimonas lacus]|uniref:Uncharacterized protein n=1 Tax=Kordiimonas lacus TaxID=637679 RepID=A0A1G7C2L8_9PROT|nr:hypothetical protein [Kordiimonas lacus]SDE33582.1 hypothetical protein SAMN04488071_2632 [Kordiimonas lacus]